MACFCELEVERVGVQLALFRFSPAFFFLNYV